MFAAALLLSTLHSVVLAAPALDGVSDGEVQKRQDYSALLDLASSAGISIPTSDPALLLSLGPVAGQLASYLPTAPVLSVLETALPSGFLSNVVHDPSYAASFESQFAAGSSPSWFLAGYYSTLSQNVLSARSLTNTSMVAQGSDLCHSLPSSVKAYLHTYSGYGGIVTEVGNAESIIATATASGLRTSQTAAAASSHVLGSATSTSATVDSTAMGTTASDNSISSGEDALTSSAATSALSASDASLSSVEATNTAPSTTSEEGNPAATLPSSTSTGAASKETRTIAAGVLAIAGIFGLAFAV